MDGEGLEGTSQMRLSEAFVKVLVKLGFVFPSRPFVEEKCRQIVEENHEVFDRLAKR